MYFSPGFALICLWSVIIIIEELFCFNKLPGCVSLCCEVPCKLCAFTLQLSSCVLCVLRAGMLLHAGLLISDQGCGEDEARISSSPSCRAGEWAEKGTGRVV